MQAGCLVVYQGRGSLVAPRSVPPTASAAPLLSSVGFHSCFPLACLSVGTCLTASYSVFIPEQSDVVLCLCVVGC